VGYGSRASHKGVASGQKNTNNMAKYTVKSKTTGNRAEVEYDELGILISVSYSFTVAAQPEAVAWMQQSLPIHEANIHKFVPGSFTVDVVFDSVTFADFWEAYDKKIGKQAAEKQWAKLSQSERSKAIKKISRYKLYCQQQSPPRLIKDPERYLSNKVFNDEFQI
jgi:hypothetical protein